MIKTIILGALMLVFLPTAVFANAGSPMMWFGILHALVLNAGIGTVESMILKKHNINHRLWMIVLANYISMFLGLFFIAPHFASISGNTDFWGGHTNYGDYEMNGFIAGMGASILATCLIELPLFYLAAKDQESKSRMISPFLMANLATNFVMFFIYYLINKPGSI